MAKRPGSVTVTTEVAYCSFCDRPRTLRREEHRLGGLVRTIVTCETCHRTLSSTMGVAATQAEAAEQAAAPTPVPEAAAEPPVKPAAAEASTKTAGATKPAAKKSAPAARPKTTTATRPKAATAKRSTRSK